jgi:LuxR family maltose regulon positive regulatory protein
LRGYGKTTAVAAWLESQSPGAVTAVWVTAGPVTNAGQGFEDRLSAALHRAGVLPGPEPGAIALRGLDELGVSLDFAPPDRRFVLVIDNFEHVRDEPALAELASLVERHRHFHLYVCCRGHHPIESLAVGMMKVNIIEPGELLLGTDEVLRLAQAMGAPLDRAGAVRLRDAMGGCIALAAMAMGTAGELTLRAAVIDEYVRAQLLTDVGDEALMTELMRLSLAGPFGWPLFRDLCGSTDPGRLLEDLEATGLVGRSTTGADVLFCVPAPVREVLADHFSSSAPEEARVAHRRLATWFVAHGGTGHSSRAFHHAVAGKDWDVVDLLWSDKIVTLIGDDLGLLRQSLDAVPSDVIATRPSMQVVRDIMKVATADTDADGHRATLRAFADACASIVSKTWATMPVNELLVVATGYVIEFRLLGRLQESVAFGDRANARATALAATQPANKSRQAWFSLHRGLTYTLTNDDLPAVRAYRRAWELATGSGADFVRSHAAANLALTYALGGDGAQAEEWFRRHRGLDTRSWPGDYVIGIGARVAGGLLALDRLDEAAVAAELGYLGDGSAPLELWPFIAYLYAQHALFFGRPADALAHLDQVQAGKEQADQAGGGAAAALMSRARADLLIASGRGQLAGELVHSQGAGQPWSRVPATRIRLLGGQPPGPFDIGPLIWGPATSVRDRLEMLLLGAVQARRADDRPGAQRLANQALELYHETGILRPFATIPVGDRAGLLELAQRDLRPDDAARLSRQAPVYPAELVLVQLSPQERSVLNALAGTASRQAIATSLFVSVNTVKTQLAGVYQKLGSSSRQEALGRARNLDLLPPDGPG